MNQSSLASASVGDRLLVLGIATDLPDLKSRLLALGLLPGSVVKVLRVAPLGDPMQIKVGTSLLSIRRSEAEYIRVEKQET